MYSKGIDSKKAKRLIFFMDKNLFFVNIKLLAINNIFI